jgi:aspartyl-tRNA(Asn)/glutamyl-tRNA(Gln) amidotransferase subunit A
MGCINLFSTSGAELVQVALPPSFAQVHAMHRRIMAVEAAQVHAAQFAKSPAQYGPCIASLLREGLATPAHEYQEALQHQRKFTSEIIASISPRTILLTPATPTAAPDCTTTGDPRFNSPWSYCGLPTVSFPCGVDLDGMPLSMQLIAAPWREAELFDAAAWCERTLDFQAIPPVLK